MGDGDKESSSVIYLVKQLGTYILDFCVEGYGLVRTIGETKLGWMIL